MWILVSFAIVALVIFLVMILLKIEPIISMVISVLSGLIIAYFMNHLTITYSEDKYKNQLNKANNVNDKGTNSNISTNANIATNVPTTHMQSSDSSTANLSNSNSFGFFQTGK